MNIFENVDITNINLHYWNRYVNFISNIQNKGKRKLQYKEKHHIIPKCIDETLYTNKDNIIILTPREHYIVHKILSYCYKPNTNEYNRLIFALFAMSKLKMKCHKRSDIKITSKDYEQLRIRYSIARKLYMKQHINDDKYSKLKGKGQPSANKGMIWITNGINNKYINKEDIIPDGWYKGCSQIKHDESWKQSLKDSWQKNKENRVGKNHPMYGKGYLLQGNKNGRFGVKRKYMNNGLKNKMVKLTEVDTYLVNGWKLGMIEQTSHKDKIAINKNDEVKYVNSKDLNIYLQKGWSKGNPKTAHKGINNPSYGKICVNKNGIIKRILPNQLNEYLQNDWCKGMGKRTKKE